MELAASRPRRRRGTAMTVAAVFWAAGAATPGAAAAESFEPPAETVFDLVPVVIELDGATIAVVREPTARPALRARPRSGTEARPLLELVRGEAGVEIRAGDGGAAPLILELILDLVQPLRIVGSELEITAAGGGVELSGEETGGEEVQEARAAAGTLAAAERLPVLDLEVERSTVELTGVSGAAVAAVDSSVFTAATTGAFTLRLAGGNAEIGDHRGAVDLRGLGAEIWLTALEGSLAFQIEDGSLRLRGGHGNANGVANGGLVELDGWSGSFSINGTGGTLDYRAAGERSGLSLTGVGLDASVSGLTGMLSANLRGGSLQLIDKDGNTRIQATEGAEVDIVRSGGSFDLTLHRSSARLVDVAAAQVKVDLRDGRLDGERVRHLELVAERGEVRVGGLEALGKIEVADTRVELDLSRLERAPAITLRGTSEAVVRLATPCAVELSDAQLLSDAISVTGCELYGPSSRRGRFGRRYGARGVEGNRQLVLRATVAADSHLEVEGHP